MNKRIVTKGIEGLAALSLIGAVLVGGMGAAQAKDSGWDGHAIHVSDSGWDIH